MKHTIYRWVKRILIGLSAFAGLAAVALISFVVIERHRIAQFNRTHEHALDVDPNHPVLVDAHRLLGKLKPDVSDNSLRFASMPSFGKRWFAISVEETDGMGVGEAVVVSPDGAELERRSFEMPRSELISFLERWDSITDGYRGEGRGLTDGSPLAFERRRGDRVTSGEGNSPCHYDVLGDWAAQRLARYVPELLDLRYEDLGKLLKSDFCNRSVFDLR